MARIAGIDLPVGKRVEIALTYIYGIGQSTSQQLLDNAGISRDTFVRDLTEDEVIKLRDAIQGFGADAILNACGTSTGLTAATGLSPACSLIHRDPAGSLWLTSNGYVDDTPVNVGGLRTRGLEFNGGYNHEFDGIGTVSLSMVGTLLDKYETDNGLTEVYDCAGLYGPTCGSAPSPGVR